MSNPKVMWEQLGDVAVVTLNDPSVLNAMSVPMIKGLDHAVREIAAGTARAMILTGAGRAFCAGAGLKDALETGGGRAPDLGRDLETYINPLMRTLRALPIPWISAVRGPAVGAGCALALAADMVIASETADFMLAFTRIGLAPDGGSTHLLTRGVSRVRAMEMLLLGDRTPASHALEWGLINRVVADDTLEDVAMGLAQRLAKGPTQAYAMVRDAVWQALDLSWEEVLALERRNQTVASATEDATEGMLAFVEKRSPEFRGR